MTPSHVAQLDSHKALLEQLRDPAALTAFALARERNWLALDAADVDALFANCPDHPAYRELASHAEAGGKLGLLQLAIFGCFLALAFLLTSFLPQMPPVLFFMWGGLGVALGLLLRKYPGLLRRYLSVEQARKLTASPRPTATQGVA